MLIVRNTVQNITQTKERRIMIQPYKRGFETKDEAIHHIRNITIDLDNANVWNNSKLNSVVESQFLQMLKNGQPHVTGSWIASKRNPREIQDYRTNIFCFDIDRLENFPDIVIRKIIDRLYEYFHYVQESFSSGEKLQQKRFHCYLVVTTLQVDYEVIALIYKQVRDQLSAKIGVSFDESIYPVKTIFASGKEVKVNNKLREFDLQPFLENFITERMKLSNKSKELSNGEVVDHITTKEFNREFVTSAINFDVLLNALKKLPLISDYREWIRILMAFNDMEKEGLITDEQKIVLAEAIDDGNKSYGNEMEKIERYDGVTIGTLIYKLQQYGISTSEIFTVSENCQLRADLSMDIQGKIAENPEVFRKIEEILYSEQYRGKRILLTSDTGTGKSYAILKFLENMTKRTEIPQLSSCSSEGFSTLIIPRRNLVNNLRNQFERITRSKTVTGSDRYTIGKREEIIRNSRNILTTLDHFPYVLKLKLEQIHCNETAVRLEEQKMQNEPPKIMVFDECHMLSLDANFKPDAVREFCIAETSLLNAGGISLHVTATTQNLRSEDYDFIIKLNQLEREIPFQQAGYLFLDGSSKQVELKMLETTKMAVKKNPHRRLLVFIERKEIIYDFSKKLNEQGIKSIEVISNKEELKSQEEKLIVSDGLIPDNVQVILATTSLSAGVSILNNHVNDEVWVLCSHRSLNHEMTRIVQMSHRFRNTYHALKLFIQKAKPQEKKKVFPYHSILNEEVIKAEKFKQAIEMLRENQIEGRTTLDKLEMENSLYADEEGTLHVCTPLIQSEIVFPKTYYNYKNPDVLLGELENKFECKFLEMKGKVEIDEKEEVVKGSKITSQDMLRRIVEDKAFYNQLKNDYFIYGRSQFTSEMKRYMKLSTVKDLQYFFENSIEYGFAKLVLRAHLNAKRAETLSYTRDKEAMAWLKDIKRGKGNTLSGRMYKVISKHLKLSMETKNLVEFSRKKEIDSFLQAVAREELKDEGFRVIPNKVGSFKNLLNIKERKSGNIRTYTIEGFIDEKYIKDKYGIEKIQ